MANDTTYIDTTHITKQNTCFVVRANAELTFMDVGSFHGNELAPVTPWKLKASWLLPDPHHQRTYLSNSFRHCLDWMVSQYRGQGRRR